MSQYDAAVTERPIVLAEVSNSASSDLRFTNSPQQSEPMQQEPIHPENEDLEKDWSRYFSMGRAVLVAGW